MIGRVKPLRELAERLLNECATLDTPLFGHSDSKRTSRTFKKYVRLALPEREDIHLHSQGTRVVLNYYVMEFPFIRYRGGCATALSRPLRTMHFDLLNSDVGEQVGRAFLNFEVST